MKNQQPKRLTLTLPHCRWWGMTTEQRAEMRAKYDVKITGEVA